MSYDIPFLLSDVKKMEHVQPLLKSLLRAISSSDSTCKLSLIHRIYSEVVVSLRSIHIYVL